MRDGAAICMSWYKKMVSFRKLHDSSHGKIAVLQVSCFCVVDELTNVNLFTFILVEGWRKISLSFC